LLLEWNDMDSEKLFEEICSKENIEFVKNIINKMEPDPVIGPLLMDVLNKNQGETRGFVAWAAKKLQPKRYLEIGTRRGWSAAMVAVAAPACELFCFDVWEENYSSCPNPGPEFVSNELKKLGYTKDINFINGDSHKTLPEFFNNNPGIEFDLILVDGDHTVDGAFADLSDTMPHIRKGGMMVFDDIVICDRLDEVFYHLKNVFPDFEYHAYTKNIPGVGIAIRNE
jgi:predicted O-methyltransferase YrrM